MRDTADVHLTPCCAADRLVAVEAASGFRGDAYRYRVEITYQPRTDVTTSYREGFEVVTAQRVASIRVASGTETLRRYALLYDTTLSLTRLAQRDVTVRLRPLPRGRLLPGYARIDGR